MDCSHFVPIYSLPLQEKEEGNIDLSKNPSTKYSKWELMKCKLPMPLSNTSSLVFDDYYLLIFGKGITSLFFSNFSFYTLENGG